LKINGVMYKNKNNHLRKIVCITCLWGGSQSIENRTMRNVLFIQLPCVPENQEFL